uniref:E3 ubiquitin-protein ligase TRIM39-like n=1 Tax=Pelusios castaneus TaxID=367368 RepID=A0A8C8RK06_9SAUR
MASPATAAEIQDELICSICLEYLTKPVTITCGHNFCQACITQHCEEWEKGRRVELTCPQCRELFQKGEFKPNTQLNNIVQKIKQLERHPGKGKEPKADLCKRHEKRLKLFCEEDGEAICWVCEKSRDHRWHTGMSTGHCGKWEKIQTFFAPALQVPNRNREKRVDCSVCIERVWALKVKEKRAMITGEFNRLHTWLKEEEQGLLQRLAEEERETLQRLQENVSKLSQQSSSLKQLIAELEKKCQQRLSDQGTVGCFLPRSQSVKLQEPGAVSTELKNVYKICLDMKEMLQRFWVDVTLDPDTAHPELVLSEDRKRVRHGDKRQDLPDTPARFDPCPCVLGAEQFTGGRRYWEVEVGHKTEWSLGVCRESVSKKGTVTLTPGNGYWAVWLRTGEYKARTSPSAPLPVRVRPSRVGIFLDYEAGEVSFYNVTDGSHLFTFTDTFSGTLRPYFYPGLNAGGTNAAPLIICPIPAQAGRNL